MFVDWECLKRKRAVIGGLLGNNSVTNCKSIVCAPCKPAALLNGIFMNDYYFEYDDVLLSFFIHPHRPFATDELTKLFIQMKRYFD